MPDPIADLTEKEKEALRLLLGGHDTKSSAVKLDISVHTVNDRLRNARRKLGVTSSREAARILGDAEGETPQITAHTSSGITGALAAADNAVLNQTSQQGPSRFIWLTGGMLIMSIFIAAAIIAVISSSSDEAPGVVAPQGAETSSGVSQADLTERDSESYAKAQRFLAKVDAGDWKGSWEIAGKFIQSQASAEEWTQTVQPVREPLGKVTSREFASLQKTTELPGAPEGDYEVLQFTTTFENREEVSTETVIAIRTADGFDIAGFFIR